jgi:endonuclease YncB( thermonuclease family)
MEARHDLHRSGFVTRVRRRSYSRTRGLRPFDVVTALCFVLVLSFAAAWVDNHSRERIEGRARVVDGDSLELEGRRLRLRGIDAPEIDQTCVTAGKEQRCGLIAARQLRAQTEDQTIECRLYQTDRYGRDLAECKAGGTALNAWMVRTGLAVSYGDFAAEEQLARAERTGIWAGTFERPADWRKRQGKAEEAPHAPTGRIRAFIRALLGV